MLADPVIISDLLSKNELFVALKFMYLRFRRSDFDNSHEALVSLKSTTAFSFSNFVSVVASFLLFEFVEFVGFPFRLQIPYRNSDRDVIFLLQIPISCSTIITSTHKS
jgi:hypothetical protein